MSNDQLLFLVGLYIQSNLGQEYLLHKYCINLNTKRTYLNVSVKNLQQIYNFEYHTLNTPPPPLPQVTMLVPGVPHVVESLVNNVSELGVADSVRILVTKDACPRPVLTALINMPASDALAQPQSAHRFLHVHDQKLES